MNSGALHGQRSGRRWTAALAAQRANNTGLASKKKKKKKVALWWVRAEGVARVLEPGDPRAARALELLRERYAPYAERPPRGPVLAVDVTRWSGWAARG